MPASKGTDYSTYIQSPEWRAKANAAKQRAGNRCQICNRPSPQVQLDAHHRTYERLGDESPEDITVLCRDCHELFSKRGTLQVQAGQTTKARAGRKVDTEQAATVFWVVVIGAGLVLWWYFNREPTQPASTNVAPTAVQQQTTADTGQVVDDPYGYEEQHQEYLLDQQIAEEQAAYDASMEEQYADPATCPTNNRDSNLRAGPGVNYDIIGNVKAGACIPVAGQNQDGTWYWFQKEDVFGPDVDVWIRSYLVDNAPANLPVVGEAARSVPAPMQQQAQACTGGCTTKPTWCGSEPIKGNVQVGTGEKIYHAPGQQYYDKTTISPAYGERWFCTEAEAQAAGWRKAFR